MKRAASKGPVIITERGKPAHVLMTVAAYEKLKGRTSGHLRITKTSARRGDNTQMARISFVDDLW